MSEIIDKEIINKILNTFKEHIDDEYDEKYGGFYLWKYMEQTKKNERHLVYLIEHGLCKVYYQKSLEQELYFAAPMSLTSKGIDYLSENGGLTAQEKTITIRFEEDTIKKLIEAKIESMNATEKEKHSLKQYLKSLSGKILEEKVLALVSLGINHIPDLTGWLGKS